MSFPCFIILASTFGSLLHMELRANGKFLLKHDSYIFLCKMQGMYTSGATVSAGAVGNVMSSKTHASLYPMSESRFSIDFITTPDSDNGNIDNLDSRLSGVISGRQSIIIDTNIHHVSGSSQPSGTGITDVVRSGEIVSCAE